AINSTWDINTTLNWSNAIPASSTYHDGDNLLFTNGPTNRAITLNVTVQPATIVISNNAGVDYSISGTGSISGATGLVKNGSVSGAGTLTLSTNNTYTGTTSINAGTLIIGSGGTTGSLGSGSVLVNGSLRFNHSDGIVVSNTMSGLGFIQQIGTGTLTLSGANSGFMGNTFAASGTLKPGSASAFGANNTLVLVSSGAT